MGSHYSQKVICNDGLSSMSWSTLCHWLHSAKLLKKIHSPCEKSLRAAPDSWTELFNHHVFCLTAYWGMNVLLIQAPGLWPACVRGGVGWGGNALVQPVYIKAWCDCIQFRQLLQLACKSIRLDRAIIHSLFTSFVSLCTPRYHYITKNTFIRSPQAAVAGLLNCLWGFLMCLCFFVFLLVCENTIHLPV